MTEAALMMTDLEKLALSLEFGNQARLLNTIKRMRLAQSCISDLKLASDTCDAFVQFSMAKLELDPTQRTAAEHALIANAIILYGRATSTTGARGERGSVSIRDRLSSPAQIDHDALVSLRNRVIAHVYADELVADDVWHREYAVAATDDEVEWIVSCVTRRKQTDGHTLERLRRLIPVAWNLLHETYQKRVAEVVELMHAAGVRNEQLRSFPVDPAQIFGTYEEALLSWSKRTQGENAGVIYY